MVVSIDEDVLLRCGITRIVSGETPETPLLRCARPFGGPVDFRDLKIVEDYFFGLNLPIARLSFRCAQQLTVGRFFICVKVDKQV